MRKVLLVSILVVILGASPCFAIEFCGDGCTVNEAENFEVSFCLEDVPEPLITAAIVIEFNPAALKVDSVSFDDVWDPAMSSGNSVAGNPGKYLVTAGNLSKANPDGNDNIGIATVIFSCLVANCAGQQITVSTVPGFGSVVESSGTIYDSQIEPKTFTILQCTTTTTTGSSSCLSEEIYGEHSAETELLRSLRDNDLSQTPEGRELIKHYYQWSPLIVKAMNADEEFKQEVKDIVDEIVHLISQQHTKRAKSLLSKNP